MRDFEVFLRNMAAILLTLAALFLAISWWGGSSMVGFIPPIFAQALALICVVFALSLLIASWFIGSRRKKDEEEANNGLNITLNSRDFVTKDTEQINAFFNGLERLIKAKKDKKQKEVKDK